MRRGFWTSFIGTIVGLLLLFGVVFIIAGSSKDKSFSTAVSNGESADFCLDKYKNKLEEYRFAITEAQNLLDEAFGYPTPTYDDLMDIIKGTQEHLDIDLFPLSC